MAHIELDHLTKRYGPVTAVDDLSFTLEPGTITGFLGPTAPASRPPADAARADPTRPPAPPRSTGGPTRSCPTRPRAVGALTDSDVFHPGRSGRTRCGCWRARAASRPRGSTRCSSWSAWAARPGGGSAATPWACGSGSPWPPRCWATRRDPGARRAGQRAGPGGRRTGCAACCAAWPTQGRTVLVSSHLLAELAQTVDDVIVIDRGRLIVHGPMTQLIGDSHATSLEDLFFHLVAKGTSP